ncbi:hypothetical protein BC835DRAFT_1025483 [Cytidiella melzeri]|nr:hypothetical protein BC835DRAFT_1025483 [Cytidiella melzeri]
MAVWKWETWFFLTCARSDPLLYDIQEQKRSDLASPLHSNLVKQGFKLAATAIHPLDAR